MSNFEQLERELGPVNEWTADDQAAWEADQEELRWWQNASDEEIDARLDAEEAEELANGWDGEPVLSEYEQGWANIRVEERANVDRQNREDAEYANRPRSFYQGVEGRWNPEDGWIYEP